MRYYLLIVLVLHISCKKSFLDVDDNTLFYRQQYVTDLKTMRDFLNGIYLKYAVNIGYGTSQAYPEVIADNLKPTDAGAYLTIQYSWTQQADISDGQEFAGISPTATAMNPLWRIGYQIIRNCNFVIEETDKYSKEDPMTAENLKGQAFALRALVHFKLVNVFAQSYGFTDDGVHPGVPYITSSDISISFPRLTVVDVYKNMIEDYQRAITMLPQTVADNRYLNINAARALLARTYLFKGDYNNAREISVDVASRVPLMSIAGGYPDGLFKYSQAALTETLFALSPNQGMGSSVTTRFLGAMLNGLPRGFKATNDIAELLRENPNDIRRSWVSGEYGNWSVVKFPQESAPEVKPALANPAGAYYPVEIRTSEMFLTAAEACARMGDEKNACVYLNAIRQRANPSNPPLTATGAALLDSIYKERRKELSFEGLRMYDLQRWKKSVLRQDFLFPYAIDLPYPNNKAIAPIPGQDVTLSEMQQNAGY